MLPHIIPLIPDHKCYCEPFAGGATVLFRKKRVSLEIINDRNDNLINFYKVLKNKNKYKKFRKMCHETLYARSEHNKAKELYRSSTDEIERAWAFWFKINAGFSGKLDGGFCVTKDPGSSPASYRLNGYKASLDLCSQRIERTIIENTDALKCISVYDAEYTFFYIDPPYLNADQGHYKGYSQKDFFQLLEKISTIKGKFLISCYPDNLISTFIDKHDWNCFQVRQRISAANRNRFPEAKRMKTEMLVWNYDAPGQMELFQ